jgi:Leucyl-tRNA synthetase
VCERCKTPVEQRLLQQWFFRISDFAPRLLSNLDHMDWSETTKTAQRNWIGKSEGVEIAFSVRARAGECEIRVFTTRPDTIYGATYLVIAPEHPLVDSLTGAAGRKRVDAYREQTKKQDIITRKTSAEKTGVFTGSHATNPATGKEIPIWVSDYVLMEYGTGAIMGVPGHDQRDFEFASKFELPIVRVVSGEREDANAPLSAAYTECDVGTMVNSGALDGLGVEAAKRTIVEMLARRGSAKAVVNYRLHDWCISRQRYWGPPIPIIYCDACGTVPVPEKDLPVVLPFIEDFKPDDSGVSPLARHEEWYRVPCPKCGAMGRRETDVSDTFLDSLVFPALSQRRERRCRFREDNHEEMAAGGLVYRWQRARGASPVVLALHHDGIEGRRSSRVRRALRPLPRARPHHPRRREDVENPGQHR